jgi:hypothetical protein
MPTVLRRPLKSSMHSTLQMSKTRHSIFLSRRNKRRVPSKTARLAYKLCAQGFPEGTRNNGLFNIGVYLKRAHPGSWEDKMVEYNLKYVAPPLPNNEVQIIIKQAGKKDYQYKCKDSPLNSFCNSGLCRSRKFGIGAHAPDAAQIASLSKYASDPPLWFLDVNGKRVELETEMLYNQAAFQKACLRRSTSCRPHCASQIGKPAQRFAQRDGGDRADHRGI